MSRSTFLGPHAVGILLALSASDSMGLTRILRPEPEMDPLFMLNALESRPRSMHPRPRSLKGKPHRARKNRSKIKAARTQNRKRK